MLEKIDSSFIYTAQWIVRQIELYTPITKKHVEDILITCYFWMIAIFAVTIVTAMTLDLIETKHVFTFGLLFLLLAPLYFSSLKVYKHIANTTRKVSDMLPAVIHQRKYNRKAIIVSVPLAFLIIFAVIAVLFSINRTELLSVIFGNFEDQNILFSVCASLVWFILPTEFLIEYVFCTTSLPPGEKEKRATEKEMRNMTPTSIKN